ncbi:MAG: SusC/RagA family TonB-linked outer membrane protein, partial [Tannerellaceae bacterium]
KDASATAIYGSRAGHGVIIVTTKRGKQGKPLIKYSGTVALQNIAKNYDMLNARDFMIESNRFLREEWMLNNKVAPYGTNNIQDIKDSFVPRFSDANIANPINSTDWMNEVTRTGFQQQHNVSMNGGTDGTQYMVSLNYFKQDGIIKNNDMTRYAGRVNLDQQINKYLKTGVSLALNRNDFGNVPVGDSGNEYAGTIVSATQFNPLIPIRDENGNYALNSAAAFLPNPVSLLEIDDKSRQERVLGTLYLEAEPIKDLKIKANMGLDRNYQKRKTYLPKTTLYGQKKNGEASINQYDKTDYLFELTGNYQKTINVHSINVLGGYSYQKFEGEGMNAANSDFLIDGFGYNNLGAGAFAKPTVGSWGNSSCMASFFGRFNYSLLDRYLLTATLRADGASNLAKNHKWGYFPSVALGWRFSEENFMERVRDVITNGKLRVSYGETGNSNIGNKALDYYSITGEYVFGDIAYKGVGLGQLGNPNLKWETTKEWNFGLDLGLYDRVNISAEVFSRRIVDLLSTRNLMSFLEVGAIAANIGSTKSKGFELTVGSRNIITSSFNWSSDVTFSMYRDTWDMRDPSWKPAAYEKYNDPIRSAYGYKSAGLI